MANMDHIGKQSEAAALQTATVMPPGRKMDRWMRWRHGMAGGVLGLGLLLGVLRLPVMAGGPPAVSDSCSGPFGCLNNVGTVGNHSCNSRYACNGNRGKVGADACNGEGACLGNTGTVGNGACVGTSACVGNKGTIGPGQCLGDQSCPNNSTNIP
jgi:hypothetical protein